MDQSMRMRSFVIFCCTTYVEGWEHLRAICFEPRSSRSTISLWFFFFVLILQHMTIHAHSALCITSYALLWNININHNNHKPTHGTTIKSIVFTVRNRISAIKSLINNIMIIHWHWYAAYRPKCFHSFNSIP